MCRHFGGLARAPALERAPDFEEFADFAGLDLDQIFNRLVRHLRLARDDERSGAMAHFHKPDQFGAIDRFPDRLPAGVERVGEVTLSR